MKTQGKTRIAKKNEKMVVTQDNKFVYAKYNMSANEMKFFMWIVGQINNQKDQLFQICEVPLNQVIDIWQWNKNRVLQIDYAYIREICHSMSKKVYIEDFKLLDEKTMKQKNCFKIMPLFQWISYKDGESCVSYKLNDSLMEYLLDLKHNFTQIKFKDIQQMKSAYSIRIYTMLVSELKQNRQNLKISVAVLQNILEVPKSLEIWDNFKQKVLNQATKDINGRSNIILLEIKTFKTGRKITEIEFIFDYKNNDKRILRDKTKQKHFNDKIIEVLDTYSGKSFFFEKLGGTFQYYGWKYANEDINQIVAVFERISDKKFFYIAVKNFKNDINILEQCKNKAEELFYISQAKEIQQSKEFLQNLLGGKTQLFQRI